MWWTGQNLEQPRYGPDGTPWYFQVWHDHVDCIYIQRIYFWDESRRETGVMEVTGNNTLHVSRLKQRMIRLAKDPEFRRRFHQPLHFPLKP